MPSVWAIGDVTDRINLTPVAIHEGMCLAKTLFADEPTRPDHSNVASAVFSQPPIGSVGLTETAAREAYGEIDVYRSSFRPLKHTLTGRNETTMMKHPCASPLRNRLDTSALNPSVISSPNRDLNAGG